MTYQPTWLRTGVCATNAHTSKNIGTSLTSAAVQRHRLTLWIKSSPSRWRLSPSPTTCNFANSNLPCLIIPIIHHFKVFFCQKYSWRLLFHRLIVTACSIEASHLVRQFLKRCFHREPAICTMWNNVKRRRGEQFWQYSICSGNGTVAEEGHESRCEELDGELHAIFLLVTRPHETPIYFIY